MLKQYAFPELVTHLMIEYQEYLYVLQRVQATINPKVSTKIRKSTEVTNLTGDSGNPGSPSAGAAMGENEAPGVSSPNAARISANLSKMPMKDRLQLPTEAAVKEFTTFLCQYM
jgi:hypothetical protein